MTTLTRPTRVVDGEEIEVQTDDTFQILLELGGDTGSVLATVTTAFGMQQYLCPAVEVYGLDGTVQMLGDDWAPDGLQVWQNSVGAWQTYHSKSRYWPWTDGLRHLIDCVRTGQRPTPGPSTRTTCWRSCWPRWKRPGPGPPSRSPAPSSRPRRCRPTTRDPST